MQAGMKNDLIFNYNLGIRLWILKVRLLRLILHKSVKPKLRFTDRSPVRDSLTPLQLSVPFSFSAICLASSVFLFVIKFTSSTSQPLFHSKIRQTTTSHKRGAKVNKEMQDQGSLLLNGFNNPVPEFRYWSMQLKVPLLHTWFGPGGSAPRYTRKQAFFLQPGSRRNKHWFLLQNSTDDRA